MTEALDVWLYGTRLALVEQDRRRRLSLQYSDEGLGRFGLASPVLSCALPLRRERYPHAVTRDFFDGLLPEGATREMLARELGIAVADTFGFLEALGRDCAGALIVQRSGEPAPPAATLADARRISTDEVARRLAALPRAPLGIDDEVRLSLAGIQHKLLLTRGEDGAWALPIGGVPSTHLLKPEIDNPAWPGTVENEAFCMRLAERAGLPVAEVDIEHFGGRPVLVVRRFDRTVADGVVGRIHQEDGCQALGIPPERKYQDSGGPSLRAIAQLLTRFDRSGDLRALVAQSAFNVAIGNADAHGKNFSLLHRDDGSIELSPAYDLMSTERYPLSVQMGMTVDGVHRLDRVSRERIVNEAVSWGMARETAEQAVAVTLGAVAETIDPVAHEMDADHELVTLVTRRTDALLRDPRRR